MKRRGAIAGMVTASIAAMVPFGLIGKGQELMEVWQWDFAKGEWFLSRMKDLHEHELFTMVCPDGQRFNDGEIYQAQSEPYLVYEGKFPDGSLLNQPTWGIVAKEVEGDTGETIDRVAWRENLRKPQFEDIATRITDRA